MQPILISDHQLTKRLRIPGKTFCDQFGVINVHMSAYQTQLRAFRFRKSPQIFRKRISSTQLRPFSIAEIAGSSMILTGCDVSPAGQRIHDFDGLVAKGRELTAKNAANATPQAHNRKLTH